MDLFGKARLLTFDHDPMTREPTVEVARSLAAGMGAFAGVAGREPG